MRKALLIIPLILCSSAPVFGQLKALDKVNGFLGRITGTPVANRPSSSPQMTPSSAIVEPTSEQITSMGKAISASVTAAIAADRQSAAQLIADLVKTSACATDGRAWNKFNRVNEKPRTYTTDNRNSVPMLQTQYHNKSQCLDVIRIDEWSKPAKNALQFKVRMISAQSDEVASQTFLLVRQPTNEWQVRDIGGTYA